MDKKEAKMLDLQSKLPSLPLPSLQQSCQRYLDSVKPFVDGNDFEKTTKMVLSFQNGVGKLLHGKLEEMAKYSKNWLQDWWYDVYLNYRGPSPVYGNTAGGMEKSASFQPIPGSQIKNSALWLYTAVNIFNKVIHQELPIQYLRRKFPLDMSQYVNLFCGGRIPGEPKDTQVHFVHVLPKKDGSMEVVCNIKHVVVLTAGRIFKLDVFNKNGDILKPPLIEKQLRHICDLCKNLGDGPHIGWLTGADRSTWFKAYKHLCSLDKQNKININIINEAILALSLEDVLLYDLQDSCELGVLGDVGNRWLDKSLNEIVSNTGMLASTEDHIHCDGNVCSGLLQKMGDMYVEIKDHWKGNQCIYQDATDPIELAFTVDDKTLRWIEETKTKHRKLVSDFILIDRPMYGYGKDYAKENHVNPDTLVQMAIQLAYYRIHKKCASVYESATTRMFYHGRTETVRSCTVEVTEWIKAMCSNHNDNEKIKELFFRAVKKHNKLMKDACDGQGFDRHFYGLRKVAEEEGLPLPDIFKDKAWELSGGSGFTISSSLSGYFACHGGLSPLVADGYGTFYTIEPHRVNICVTSFKSSKVTKCQIMYDSIYHSFILIDALLHPKSPKL